MIVCCFFFQYSKYLISVISILLKKFIIILHNQDYNYDEVINGNSANIYIWGFVVNREEHWIDSKYFDTTAPLALQHIIYGLKLVLISFIVHFLFVCINCLCCICFIFFDQTKSWWMLSQYLWLGHHKKKCSNLVVYSQFQYLSRVMSFALFTIVFISCYCFYCLTKQMMHYNFAMYLSCFIFLINNYLFSNRGSAIQNCL